VRDSVEFDQFGTVAAHPDAEGDGGAFLANLFSEVLELLIAHQELFAPTGHHSTRLDTDDRELPVRSAWGFDD
jgi:hypothetical protein